MAPLALLALPALLLASLHGGASAQGAVCSPNARSFCLGYTVPSQAVPFTTYDASNQLYVFSNTAVQCTYCGVHWVGSTVVINGVDYSAFNCPRCCWDFASCYAAANIMQSGNNALTRDLPDPATSWESAAPAGTFCDVWLMPDNSYSSAVFTECANCHGPWQFVNVTADPVGAAALGIDLGLLGTAQTVCRCSTMCWPLGAGLPLPPNAPHSAPPTQFGYYTALSRNDGNGVSIRVDTSQIVAYAGSSDFGFTKYSAYGVFIIPSVPCIFAYGGTVTDGFVARLAARTAALVSPAPVTTVLLGGMNAFAPDCTGTAIAPYWILTAAHCVQNRQLRQTYVAVGQTNMSQGVSSWSVALQYISHPQYDPVIFANDIALVKVSSMVPGSALAQPIMLDNSTDMDFAISNVPGTSGNTVEVIMAGYGNGPLSDGFTPVPGTLTWLDEPGSRLTIRDHYSCISHNLAVTGQLPPAGSMCGGFLNGSHDTCSGDSGGPSWRVPDNLTTAAVLYGLTSSSMGASSACVRTGLNSQAPGGSWGRYTPIKPYLPWIFSVIGGTVPTWNGAAAQPPPPGASSYSSVPLPPEPTPPTPPPPKPPPPQPAQSPPSKPTPPKPPPPKPPPPQPAQSPPKPPPPKPPPPKPPPPQPAQSPPKPPPPKPPPPKPPPPKPPPPKPPPPKSTPVGRRRLMCGGSFGRG